MARAYWSTLVMPMHQSRRVGRIAASPEDNQGLFKHISAKEKKKRQMKQMWKNLHKCLICVIAVWMYTVYSHCFFDI